MSFLERFGGKKSPQEIKKMSEAEETRIQNPDEAHEKANMLQVEVGEQATPEDYDEALSWLEKLQEEADRGGDGIDNKQLRKTIAGFVAAGGAAIDLLALSITTAGTTIGPYPKRIAEKSRQELVDRLKRIATDYQDFKNVMIPARERLEQWRAEAEKATTERE